MDDRRAGGFGGVERHARWRLVAFGCASVDSPGQQFSGAGQNNDMGESGRCLFAILVAHSPCRSPTDSMRRVVPGRCCASTSLDITIKCQQVSCIRMLSQPGERGPHAITTSAVRPSEFRRCAQPPQAAGYLVEFRSCTRIVLLRYDAATLRTRHAKKPHSRALILQFRPLRVESVRVTPTR